MQDTLNDRQQRPETANNTLEPKLNLINDNKPYAKMDHLSYLQRGNRYPVTTFEQRQREENALIEEERTRQELAYKQHASAVQQENARLAREKEMSI